MRAFGTVSRSIKQLTAGVTKMTDLKNEVVKKFLEQIQKEIEQRKAQHIFIQWKQMELQPHKYYKKRIAELEQKMAVALDKMELVQKELFLVKAEYEQWKEKQK